MIVNKEHRGNHDDYLKKYLATGETNVINSIRTIDAVKKDGALFPIELSVSAIEIEDIWFLGIIRDLDLRNFNSICLIFKSNNFHCIHDQKSPA